MNSTTYLSYPFKYRCQYLACSLFYHLSLTAGTPRFRIEPSSFGICTLRTGNGLYRLCLIISFISSPCSEMNSGSRLTGIRSIPADPLLLITLCRASSRFPSVRMRSSNSVAICVLLSPFRRLEYLTITPREVSTDHTAVTPHIHET